MKKYIPPLVATVLPVIAGCLAHGADATGGALGSPVSLNWGSFVTAYGPMTVMLGWCFYDARERRKEDKDHRAEWKKLLQMNIEVLTQVKEALSQARADSDKNRGALYRMADEMREVRVAVSAACDGMSRNTRVMARDG